MNQIIETFTISAETNNSEVPVHQQLMLKIQNYTNENKYKIVSISHHVHWYQRYVSWGGNAIVVFEPIENPNNSTNQTANLLDFEK